MWLISYLRNLFQYIYWFLQTNFNYPQYLLENKYRGVKIFSNDSKIINFSVYKKINNFVIKNNLKEKGIVVSLSGGVDSMVVLYCLIHLKLYSYPKMKLGTVSVNYNVRNESEDEMKFLSDYLKPFIENNIVTDKIIVNVTNSSRKNSYGYNSSKNKRKVFEEESKKIRYNGYNKLLNSNYHGVMLGHHKDDIIENIFTNMMYGRNILDLTVMKEISEKNGVTFYRPLRELHKTDIYELAHYCDVPYFKDTTPLWSKRGIMRKQIFPLLDKTFNNWNIKLHKIGKESDTLQEFFKDKVYNEYKNLIEKNKNGLLINKKFFEDICIVKNLLPSYIHSYGYSYFGDKLLLKLINIKNNNFQNINKNFIAYMNDDNIYLFIKPLVISYREEYKSNTTFNFNNVSLKNLLNNEKNWSSKPYPKNKVFWKNLFFVN